MTRDEINVHCSRLPHSTHVVQWGGWDVWKVGGKVFAIVGTDDGHDFVSFKVTPMVYDLLSQARGYRPAPYLAPRGMSWLQVHDPAVVSRADIVQHIDVSHELVVAGLTKKKRTELGL